MKQQKVIAIWCAPRSASTTLFRAFSRINKIRALFEPYDANFYFSKERKSFRYLSENKVDRQWNNEVEPKIKNRIYKKTKTGLTVVKECAFQASNYLNKKLIQNIARNIIIIRKPKLTLTSLQKFKSDFNELEAGYTALDILYKILVKNKKPIVIIDAEELLNEPERYLKYLCKFCDIKYDVKMLTWPRKSKIGFGG